jgi:hypothetical protein
MQRLTERSRTKGKSRRRPFLIPLERRPRLVLSAPDAVHEMAVTCEPGHQPVRSLRSADDETREPLPLISD